MPKTEWIVSGGSTPDELGRGAYINYSLLQYTYLGILGAVSSDVSKTEMIL
jgi:hypothetical protein